MKSLPRQQDLEAPALKPPTLAVPTAVTSHPSSPTSGDEAAPATPGVLAQPGILDTPGVQGGFI